MLQLNKLFIINGDVKLEAEYSQSSGKKTEKTMAVIICHPHPQFGGNMDNNIVMGVFKELVEKGIPCLRFNFRAVGRSTGEHGDGKEERTDVKACIDFLLKESGIEKIFICGYSYGAAIGCSTINHSEHIIGYIAIAFPWDFMGSDFKEKAQTKKPKLFIQGNMDTIANYKTFEKHYKFYDEPKKKVIIEGADHMFWGHETEVAEEVSRFLNLMY